MTGLRPFASVAELFDAADRSGRASTVPTGSRRSRPIPRIGDIDALRAKFATTAAWSAGEQSGVAGASEACSALAEGNSDITGRFGRVFLVCATGKTADEMLDLIRARLGERSRGRARSPRPSRRRSPASGSEKLLA